MEDVEDISDDVLFPVARRIRERAFYSKEAERREINRKMEARKMTTTTQVSVTGSLVQVEVLGGIDHGDPPVLTYRAHADLHIGDWVFVPAPWWVVRATGDDRLPGRVVGAPETEASVPAPDTLRYTMPLCEAESHAESFSNGKVETTVSLLRKSAEALSGAYKGLAQAADLLEGTQS